MRFSLRRGLVAAGLAGLLVVPGLGMATRSHNERTATRACPAGFSTAVKQQRIEQRAGIPERGGEAAGNACLNAKHPESVIELIRRQEALETVRSAPTTRSRPAAVGQSFRSIPETV